VAEPPRALPQLLAGAVGGVVIGLVLVVAVDGLFSLLGAGKFGQLTGFLAIVPAALYMHAVQKAIPGPSQLMLTVVSAILALIPALALAFEVGADWPRLLSGALGAFAFVLIYVVLWYAGLRWLTQRSAQ